MGLGLRPPEVDELGQLLGVLGGEVVALRSVHLVVVELPRVVIEGHARGVAGDRLPAVGVDGPVAHHLGVLDALAGGRVGVGERVVHGRAGDGELLVAPVGLGRGDADELVDGGGHVVHPVELVPDAAGVGDACRPVDHEGHVDPALVGVLLVPLERGVARLGPAPRVVGVAVGAADVVDALDGLLGGLDEEVEELHLVHDAEGPTLLAGAVVGEHDDHGVVELAEALEGVDHPADLGVGVVEEGGVGLLEAGGEALLHLGQVVPRLDARVAGGQLGALGHEAALDLVGEPALAGDVPALVVAAPVLLQVRRRRLVGGVGGAEGQVEEEGPIGTDRLGVVDEPDGVVDEVLGEVVALLRGGRGLDHVVVVDELGVELVGLALHEAVEAVEAPLARPLVVGAGGGGVLHGAEVPLADREGRVALVAEHLGHGGGVVGDVAPHVRVAAREVGDRAHPHLVVVAPGQQRRSGGGAHRGDVEVRVLEAAGGEAVDVRRLDVGAVAAEVAVAEVVDEDHDHVRGVVARMRRRRPPRRGLGVGAVDLTLERLERLEARHGRIL